MRRETTTQEKPAAVESSKLYMESTLLRIAGALFCHDQKSAVTRTAEIELNSGIVDKHIVIRPDPKLGQPGPLAHKIFVALIKKHSDYGKPVRSEIHFTKREIGRLIGRKDWGGRDSEQLSRALHEIHYTFVKTHFKKPGGTFQEHSFTVFPEILIERREFPSDPIEACTITLAAPIVRSLEDEHFTCLNHALMQRLGTVGQALYMRIFFHFANLYTGTNGNHLEFVKRYDDICAEWLGGLTVLRYESDIRRQIGTHLTQLVEEGVLASFTLAKAKSKSQGGWVVSFRPGNTFFEDYARFYRRQQAGRVEAQFEPQQKEVGEPLKLAYLFAEKRTGQPAASIAYVNSKDVETAKDILAEFSFDDAPRFLDFALAAAAATRFDVQTLGGLRQYIAPYKARQATDQAAAAREAARRQRDDEERQRYAYESYRRNEANAIFATLTAPEQTEIEEIARKGTAGLSGSLQKMMFEFKRADATAQRYTGRIASFEQWLADR